MNNKIRINGTELQNFLFKTAREKLSINVIKSVELVKLYKKI